MKLAADIIQQFSAEQIQQLEQNGTTDIQVENETFPILLDEVEILSDDIKVGWLRQTMA